MLHSCVAPVFLSKRIENLFSEITVCTNVGNYIEAEVKASNSMVFAPTDMRTNYSTYIRIAYTSTDRPTDRPTTTRKRIELKTLKYS